VASELADPGGAGDSADELDVPSEPDDLGRLAGGPAEPGEMARPAAGRWPEPGPMAEEAARLAEAAGDWARRAVPELVALLRGDRPEVTGKLVEAGVAVAAAARAVVDTLVRPAGPAQPDPAPDTRSDGRPEDPPQRRVEQIDVE
jgi:hypothetical protein